MSTAQTIQVTAELLQTISAEQAWHYRIVPGAANGHLEFWVDEAKDSPALQAGRLCNMLYTATCWWKCVVCTWGVGWLFGGHVGTAYQQYLHVDLIA